MLWETMKIFWELTFQGSDVKMCGGQKITPGRHQLKSYLYYGTYPDYLSRIANAVLGIATSM